VATGTCPGEGVEKDGKKVAARAHHGADIERVADLPVERVVDGGSEGGGVSGLISDQPGTTSAMEAHRDAVLASDCPELSHCRPRAPCDRERQARVRKHRPAGRPRRALDELDCSRGKPRCCQCRFERSSLDGAGRAQRIAANAKDDRVAAAQDAGGIGEDVRTPLENEPDHPKAIHHLLDQKAWPLDPLDHAPARARQVAPEP